MLTHHAPLVVTALVMTALTILAAMTTAPAASASGGPGNTGDRVKVGKLPGGYEVGATSGTSSAGATTTGAAPAGPQAAGTATAQPGCGLQLSYCTAAGINAGAVPVGSPGSTAPPPDSPAALALRAWQALYLPLPDIMTAPPRGSDGWVGIAEFFWEAPDQWTTLTASAQAGNEWAQVQAAPAQLTITPGQDLTMVTCNGPGIPYQQTAGPADPRACSYLYQASSLHQPKDVYTITATVTWTGTWNGADGTGGILPPVIRTTTFPLRVAEAQALVNRG
jgi:hypothetical protein